MFYNRPVSQYTVPLRRQMINPYPESHLMLEPVYGFGGGRTPWHQHAPVSQATPQADILELDDQFLVEVALPGVVLDDIELKAEQNCLTLVAKRTPALFEENGYVLRKELPCGWLCRQFEFDQDIAYHQIEARMDRGLLFISIPKVEAAVRVPVSAGAIEGRAPGVRTRVSSVAGGSNKTHDTMRGGKEVAVK